MALHVVVGSRHSRTGRGGQVRPGVETGSRSSRRSRLAAHQTGHNSGVIHSGLYYKPGSLKAKLCTAGGESMCDFSREHGVAHDRCGKVVVATEKPSCRPCPSWSAGHANGLQADGLPAEAREYEPHVSGIAALRSRDRHRRLPRRSASPGRAVRAEAATCGPTPVIGVGTARRHRRPDDRGEVARGPGSNCAGLHSDRVAQLRRRSRRPDRPVPRRVLPAHPGARAPRATLIYPVPDPRFRSSASTSHA